MILNCTLDVDFNHLRKNEMQHSLTFALFNQNSSPIESSLTNNNQQLKKNCTAVVAVLRKIAHGGEKSLEPGTLVSKCKKLNEQ